MADLDLEQFEQLMQQEQLEKQSKPSQDTVEKSKLTMQESGSHHNRQKGVHKSGTSPDSRDDGDRNNDAREKDSSRRDRDRRRGRDDKRKSRSRSRDSHSDDGRHKRRESHRGRSRSDSQEVEAKAERKRQEALQRSLEEAKRQAEEAQRDDCTVLVTRIHLRADEKEIYQFFAQAGVGKIRDIRLIRD